MQARQLDYTVWNSHYGEMRGKKLHRAKNATISTARYSIALKLSHSIKKCLQLICGKAIREKDENLLSTTNNCLELLDTEWSDKISSASLSSMDRKKDNKVEMVPLASDLKALMQFLQNQIQALKKELRVTATPEVWAKLAEVTLSQMIIFNKRRSGEASRLLVKSYEGRPNWSESGCEAIKKSLNPLEIHLCVCCILIKN